MIQIFFLVYWIPAKAKERNTPKEKMVIVSMVEKAVYCFAFFVSPVYCTHRFVE